MSAPGSPPSTPGLRTGIDETVIPIVAGCDSSDGSGHVVMRPDPYYEYSGSVSTTFTPGEGVRPPPGSTTYSPQSNSPTANSLAFIGALKAPIPTCLPYDSTPTDNLSMLSKP